MKAKPALEDVKVPVRYQLSAMWASVMFCYIYVDYFELYVPGKLQGMLEGKMAPLGPVTQTILLGTAIMMTLPSLMIFLSVVLGATLSRWLNIILGIAFTIIELIVISGSDWLFYTIVGILEAALTACIAWTAFRWPRQTTS